MAKAKLDIAVFQMMDNQYKSSNESALHILGMLDSNLKRIDKTNGTTVSNHGLTLKNFEVIKFLARRENDFWAVIRSLSIDGGTELWESIEGSGSKSGSVYDYLVASIGQAGADAAISNASVFRKKPNECTYPVLVGFR